MAAEASRDDRRRGRNERLRVPYAVDYSRARTGRFCVWFLRVRFLRWGAFALGVAKVAVAAGAASGQSFLGEFENSISSVDATIHETVVYRSLFDDNIRRFQAVISVGAAVSVRVLRDILRKQR